MGTRAYVLEDSEGEEYLLVVRSPDIELLLSIARRMCRMRSAKIKELGAALERELNGKL